MCGEWGEQAYLLMKRNLHLIQQAYYVQDSILNKIKLLMSTLCDRLNPAPSPPHFIHMRMPKMQRSSVTYPKLLDQKISEIRAVSERE